jgi:hypothetical protein
VSAYDDGQDVIELAVASPLAAQWVSEHAKMAYHLPAVTSALNDRFSLPIQPVDATHFYGALEVKPLGGLLSVGQLSPIEGAAKMPYFGLESFI